MLKTSDRLKTPERSSLGKHGLAIYDGASLVLQTAQIKVKSKLRAYLEIQQGQGLRMTHRQDTQLLTLEHN